MHVPLYRLIALLLLLVVLGGTCFAQGGTHLYFPQTPVISGGSGKFNNITVGPGSVSITGTGNGGDQISGVANINGFLYANNFNGADIGAKVNSAIAALGNQGGTILIPPGNWVFNTTIQCPVTYPSDIPIIIQGAGSSTDYNYAGTVLTYTGNGDAVNDMVQKQNARGCELRDLTLDGGSGGTNAVGFHIGGTIYSKTQNVMIRNFKANCIELDNEADPFEPSVANHWTERYDFHQTYFSECGQNSIYFHKGTGGNLSFMHGKMDVHVGLFNTQNGLYLDNVAQAVGCDFEINGNMSPDASGQYTGSLIKLVGGSYLYGKMTILPECMNSAAPSCARLDVDATSHFNGQIFGGVPGPWTDKYTPGTDVQIAYADSRFVAPNHSTCEGVYGLNPGQTAELFSVQNWGTMAAGPLTIGQYYIGNETVRNYALAASACSNNVSTAVAKETVYASGAPFTLSETCHSTADATHPAGTVSYSVTNNAPQATTLSFSFLNTLLDSRGFVVGPQPGVCF